MDKFEPQSGGQHQQGGHEDSDISIRGITLFGIFLAVGGVLSFVLVLGMIHVLENAEKAREAKLTPMQQQLQKEREAPAEGLGKEIPRQEGELKPAPDWYGRGKMEEHLSRTIKTDYTPRLQYDDEHDMQTFNSSEDRWLNSTGKDNAGNIHIPISRAMEILAQRGLPPVTGTFQPPNVGAPSAAYPMGSADTGQAVRNATGGAKK